MKIYEILIKSLKIYEIEGDGVDLRRSGGGCRPRAVFSGVPAAFQRRSAVFHGLPADLGSVVGGVRGGF